LASPPGPTMRKHTVLDRPGGRPVVTYFPLEDGRAGASGLFMRCKSLFTGPAVALPTSGASPRHKSFLSEQLPSRCLPRIGTGIQCAGEAPNRHPLLVSQHSTGAA